MGKCIIVCAGGFDRLAQPVEKDDYLIAADGGLLHLQKLGLTPNHILGDFDSLGFVPEKAEIFPVEKDDTDAMLAVRHGLAKGFSKFVIYGGLDGTRIDHTMANFQTLQYLADRGATGYLVGLTHVATVVKDGTLEFDEKATGIVSVFCMGEGAEGVTIKGLKYNLENGTLCAGYPLGVSNRFIGEKASIAAEKGSLLVVYERENGIAGRGYYGK